MFAFRDVCREAANLPARIRGILSSRLAMHIGELCMRLGEDEESVRLQLDLLEASGIVERLRPIGYEKADMDFFRIAGYGATIIRGCGESKKQGREGNLLMLEDVVSNAV